MIFLDIILGITAILILSIAVGNYNNERKQWKNEYKHYIKKKENNK